jgi:hypothetical protein
MHNPIPIDHLTEAEPDGHPVLFATIVKCNRKTVTLITEGGQQWNVAPGFLRKLTDMGQATASDCPVASPGVAHRPSS